MKKDMIFKRYFKSAAAFVIAAVMVLGVSSCDLSQIDSQTQARVSETVEQVPEFSDEPYVVINDNEPEFTESEKETTESFEEYSDLDRYGRCGVAFANVSQETMPTEDRGSIGSVKPTGWHTVRYDDLISDRYLYNRCHLIGFQLTGENANEENLITGTRYMNVEGMLPFEDEVADYVDDTGNHVLYRVTPIFEDDDMVAIGVQMEAYSVEDDGRGVCFNVFCYNDQPGITIDYATGDSHRSGEGAGDAGSSDSKDANKEQKYVLNTNSHKFHKPTCGGVEDIKAKNKKKITTTKAKLEEQGYEPCGRCRP